MSILMPEDPDIQMLKILAGQAMSVEKEFELARQEQRRLGLDIVPPVVEAEAAAARYRLLYNYLEALNRTKR